MYGEYNRPKPLVQLTIHSSIKVGDQCVVQHFHEWVSPDDPRLGKPGELKFDYGERAGSAQPSPHAQQNNESAGVDREGKSSDILPGAGVPELMEPAVETTASAASSPPEPEIRSENSASVSGWESQQQSGKETEDDGNYGDGDGEED